MNSSLASAPIAHDFSSPEPLPVRRGRPSSCTPAKVTAICALIRATGLADTAAGALAGVSRAALSRAKQDEDVEVDLGQARAQYLLPRLTAIAETRLRDGQLDWRAQAWLIKFAMPEVYGPPSRRRPLENVELPQEEAGQSASACAAETGGEGKSVTFRSEMLTSPLDGVEVDTGARCDPVVEVLLADDAASELLVSSQSVTIRSEIDGTGEQNTAKYPETGVALGSQPIAAVQHLSRRARRAAEKRLAREAWRSARHERAA